MQFYDSSNNFIAIFTSPVAAADGYVEYVLTTTGVGDENRLEAYRDGVLDAGAQKVGFGGYTICRQNINQRTSIGYRDVGAVNYSEQLMDFIGIFNVAFVQSDVDEITSGFDLLNHSKAANLQAYLK